MEEYPMARMYRDVRVGTIGGGSSQIMREIIAKIVIDDVGYHQADSAQKDVPVAKESLEQLLQGIQKQAIKADPLGKTLKFDFGGQQLFIDGRGEANAISTEDAMADCTVKLSLGDFKELVKGRLNPMSAVMTGKVKIEGDMAVAMKLQTLF